MRFTAISLMVLLYGTTRAQPHKIRLDTLSEDFQLAVASRTLRLSDSLRDLKPIDDLLRSGKVTFPNVRAYLTARKATAMSMYMCIPGDFKLADSAAIYRRTDSVLALYDEAVGLATCAYRPEMLHARFDFFSRLVYAFNKDLAMPLTQRYLADRRTLREMGYSPEREGFGAGAFMLFGRDKWIGAEISVVSTRSEFGELRVDCDGREEKWKIPRVYHMMHGLTFSYARGIDSEVNDFALSLIELYNPVVFAPLKFGVQTGGAEGGAYWFYRPTIGFGYNAVSICYSYNFMKRPAARRYAETHLLTFRFSMPVTNHSYRIRR